MTQSSQSNFSQYNSNKKQTALIIAVLDLKRLVVCCEQMDGAIPDTKPHLRGTYPDACHTVTTLKTHNEYDQNFK